MCDCVRLDLPIKQFSYFIYQFPDICEIGFAWLTAVVEKCFTLGGMLCYFSKRERMMRRNGGKEVMELQLFHGTNPELVPAICQQNFDWRICGSNGTSYGRGKPE